jgi:ribosomal protein S18 acetylase RimI-like enzyme
MYIGKVSEVTGELQKALNRLIPQLSVHKVPPTAGELNELINSESSTLLVARYPDENSAIAGILTLVIYRVPTGLRSIIENVVVDEEMHTRGIGETLIRYAIELAGEVGADGVSLTSNSRREAANQFYQSLGFELRKTNTYFYKLK